MPAGTSNRMRCSILALQVESSRTRARYQALFRPVRVAKLSQPVLPPQTKPHFVSPS